MVDIRRYVLSAGVVTLVVGAALMALSLIWGFTGMRETVSFYAQLLPSGNRGGWNMLVVIVSPFVALTGGWYAWEQFSMRRRFDELVETRKKSAFRKELPELRHLVDQLPPRYEERLKERMDELDL